MSTPDANVITMVLVFTGVLMGVLCRMNIIVDINYNINLLAYIFHVLPMLRHARGILNVIVLFPVMFITSYLCSQ